MAKLPKVTEIKKGDYLSYLPKHFGVYFKGVYEIKRVVPLPLENKKTFWVKVELT